VDVKAPRAGFVGTLDALAVGRASVSLGAGRTRADQDVDPAVGVVLRAKIGDRVEKGQALATLHVRDRRAAKPAAERVLAAYAITGRRPSLPALVLETVRR
jgi:thymidine phosphorylase